MKTFPHIRIGGGPYERGVQYGKAVADRISRSLDIYRVEFAKKQVGWAEAHSLAEQFLQHIRAYAGDLVDEMEGIAAGAGQPVSAIVIINARTELMYWKAGGKKLLPNVPDEECTSAIVLPGATSNGHLLHAQNWDWQPECAETTIVLEIAGDVETPAIMTCCEAGQLARHGFNDAGVAITANGLHSDQDYGQFGIPNPLIRRRMLMMPSLAKAMYVLNNAERAFSHHLGISQAGGEAFGIEATPQDLFVLEHDNEILTHANHFKSPFAKMKIKDLNIARTPDTLYRDSRVFEGLQRCHGAIDSAVIKKVLADDYGAPDSVCRSPAIRPGGMTSATVYTLIMDSSDRVLWLAPSPYNGAVYTEYRFAT